MLLHQQHVHFSRTLRQPTAKGVGTSHINCANTQGAPQHTLVTPATGRPILAQRHAARKPPACRTLQAALLPPRSFLWPPLLPEP
eukprot:12664205-Prorocentrum_lima.AAC.1